jgi:hypothetical protein
MTGFFSGSHITIDGEHFPWKWECLIDPPKPAEKFTDWDGFTQWSPGELGQWWLQVNCVTADNLQWVMNYAEKWLRSARSIPVEFGGIKGKVLMESFREIEPTEGQFSFRGTGAPEEA